MAYENKGPLLWTPRCPPTVVMDNVPGGPEKTLEDRTYGLEDVNDPACSDRMRRWRIGLSVGFHNRTGGLLHIPSDEYADARYPYVGKVRFLSMPGQCGAALFSDFGTPRDFPALTLAIQCFLAWFSYTRGYITVNNRLHVDELVANNWESVDTFVNQRSDRAITTLALSPDLSFKGPTEATE